MSDPNVVNSEMNPSNLSDAEIESIISGGSVTGAPDQLAEFVAELQAEFDLTPGVTPGLALADFISAPSLAAAESTAGSSTVTSIFKKGTAVAGAVSFKILLGAAAAAAGVGGAQAAGVIDLPGLGSEPTVVELPTDPGDSELGPPASVTASDSPSITVPASRTTAPVNVPPSVELVEPDESMEPEQCPPRGPTNASSTSNPSEANRQASAACNATVGGQGNGSASGDDDRGVGNDQGANDGNQSQGGGLVDGEDDDPKPVKPATSGQSDSPSPSGPKEEK